MPTLDELWIDVCGKHRALSEAVQANIAAGKRFDASSSWKAENESAFAMLFKCGLVAYDPGYHGGFVLTTEPAKYHKDKFEEWYLHELHTDAKE
jgi:hypothetical protein